MGRDKDKTVMFGDSSLVIIVENDNFCQFLKFKPLL